MKWRLGLLLLVTWIALTPAGCGGNDDKNINKDADKPRPVKS
ncbi:MAG: hypothetical protein NZO58_10360 [Gemmataceae bacterium]|nr:hypothetical protein [Gemmataceae bacterium]